MSDSSLPYRIPNRRGSKRARPTKDSESREDSLGKRTDEDLMALAEPDPIIHSDDTVRRAVDGTCIHAVNGVELIADAEGVAYWPAKDTMLVADLHLEKGSSFARRGQLLPPHDTAITLKRLGKCLDRWQPERVIALGDSFHDDEASGRLSSENKAALSSMMQGRTWIWIAGNHDPSAPTDLGGDTLSEHREDGLIFRHEPQKIDCQGEIAGHLHPKARLVRRGRHVRRSCFLANRTRMILPSFGTYTGGLDVRHPAFEGLFDLTTSHVFMRGQDQVYRISGRNLS